MVIQGPPRLGEVDLGQPGVVLAARGDHHMVDRVRQIAEELLQGGLIGGVERRRIHGSELERSSGQVLGIAAGEDDIGAFGPGSAGGFQPDAGGAADHDDGLPEQFRFALRGGRAGGGGHGSSSNGCRRRRLPPSRQGSRAYHAVP
jgi:hypothetical protein